MNLLVQRFAIRSLGWSRFRLQAAARGRHAASPGGRVGDRQRPRGPTPAGGATSTAFPRNLAHLCDSKVAEALKAKGDWCREHDGPDSQCFVCHPEHAKGFAALYEAKYGHAPPPRGDEKTELTAGSPESARWLDSTSNGSGLPPVRLQLAALTPRADVA